MFAAVGSAQSPRAVVLSPDRLVELPRLSSYDILFKQYSDEVEQNRKRIARGDPPILNFYCYRTKRGDGFDSIFTVASRCCIRYDTIATLNAMSTQLPISTGTTLILPTADGIFIFDRPQSSLEILLMHDDIAIAQNPDIWYTIGARRCFFVPQAQFSPTERAFFLDTALRMPLDTYWLSSAYGMRISPISGKWRFHSGIDLAAATGTPVYACKGGKAVLCAKGDVQLGNYIVLQHEGGMTSVYAHLSEIVVAKGATVTSGQQIGRVGQTGMATGPHLHFEIRINGAATDPQRLLSR
ncbi:MAG: M23 family metallopeptidase [Treponema sp.]|nr:M23 family metallopeptidase [Treponema sp.]